MMYYRLYNIIIITPRVKTTLARVPNADLKKVRAQRVIATKRIYCYFIEYIYTDYYY